MSETLLSSMSKLKKKEGIQKDTLAIIRTTYRNNIELTNIADNKANILLSLNALMITFLIPIVLSNLDLIVERNIVLPLACLAVTCLVTIILAAMATRPIRMGKQHHKVGETSKMSPFYFGNYYKMKVEDYGELIQGTLHDSPQLIQYIKLDLYFMGKGLGEKYAQVRTCYNVFMGGIMVTIIATIIIFLA